MWPSTSTICCHHKVILSSHLIFTPYAMRIAIEQLPTPYNARNCIQRLAVTPCWSLTGKSAPTLSLAPAKFWHLNHTIIRLIFLLVIYGLAHIAALLHASYSPRYPATETQLLQVAKSLPWSPAAAPSPKTCLITLAYRVYRSLRAPLRPQALRTAKSLNTVAMQPITPVTRDSAIPVTYLAHMISHALRPACLTQIHCSEMSVASTHASNHHLSCLPDNTPCQLCISCPSLTAPHQLVTLVTFNMLQLPMVSATHHTATRCASPVVPSTARYVHVLPP